MRHEKLNSGEEMVESMKGSQITKDTLHTHNTGGTTPVSLQQTCTLTWCMLVFSYAINSSQGLSILPIIKGEKSPKHSRRQNDIRRAAT